MFGLSDMQWYMNATAGRKEKADCIFNRLFGDNSKSNLKKVFDAFDAFPDRSAPVIFTVVMNDICGE